MTIPFTTIDHTASAMQNVLSQYQEATLFKAFISAFTAEMNLLEEQFTLFLTTTGIQTSFGAQLNGIGRILGSKTRPVNDELFRVLLNALAGAYHSEARAQDIRAILLLTVNAASIELQEFGEGIFSATIFSPNFLFGQNLIYDVVNLAKSPGVEFQNFNIADIYTDSVFSFIGDQRPQSLGYAVADPSDAQPVPTNFYDDYVFPTVYGDAVKVLFPDSSSSNPEQHLTLILKMDYGAATTAFIAALQQAWNVVGGTFGWTTIPGWTYRLTCLDALQPFPVTTNDNGTGIDVILGIRFNYTQVSMIRRDNTVVDATTLYVDANSYYLGIQGSQWNTQNPDGPIAVFGDSGVIYYRFYVFPSSSQIDSNRVLWVDDQNSLGNPVFPDDLFLHILSLTSEWNYWLGEVSQGWQFIGDQFGWRNNTNGKRMLLEMIDTTNPLSYVQNPSTYQMNLCIKYQGTQRARCLIDGIEVTVPEFQAAMIEYAKTEVANWNQFNPAGFLKKVGTFGPPPGSSVPGPYGVIGGGRYSISIPPP